MTPSGVAHTACSEGLPAWNDFDNTDIGLFLIKFASQNPSYYSQNGYYVWLDVNEFGYTQNYWYGGGDPIYRAYGFIYQ